MVTLPKVLQPLEENEIQVSLQDSIDFLVAQMVKRLPTMQETWVQSLSREDPLEKEMATDSSILAWKIPWMEEPSRLVHGVTQSQTRLSDFTFTFTLGFCSSFQCKLPALYISSPLLGISGNGVTCAWQYKCSTMIFRIQSPIPSTH